MKLTLLGMAALLALSAPAHAKTKETLPYKNKNLPTEQLFLNAVYIPLFYLSLI